MNSARVGWKWPVAVLVGVWALVGLQRNAPLFLADFIVAEFNLSLKEFGATSGVLGLAWAIGSLLAGPLAERKGTKPLIIMGGLVTALFGWFSGLVQSFVQLLGVRAAVGLAEGAVMAPNFTLAGRIAPPEFRARAISVMFAAFVLVGMVLAPPLLGVLGTEFGWRSGFFIVAVPLFVLCLLVWRFVPEQPFEGHDVDDGMRTGSRMLHVLKHRNVFLCAVIAFCSISRVFVFMTFGLLFFLEVHGLPRGVAAAALAVGLLSDMLGGVFFGWVSDKLNTRRWVVAGCGAACLVMGMVFANLPDGTATSLLLGTMVLFMFFGGGVAPQVIGVIPQESVEPRYAPIAVGTSNSFGELFGAGLIPVIAGIVGDQFGLASSMMVAAVMAVGTVIFGLALRETSAMRMKR